LILTASADALPPRPALGYFLSAVLLSTISFLDDLRSLSAFVRLSVHGLCALIIIATCGYLSEVTAGGSTYHLGAAGAILTWLWIVGLTNAYNFMDGIDGLAGAQAVFAGIGWAVFGSLWNEPVLLLAGALIATTALGFLRYNWPPASIFMGDVGSAFLGFTFAVLPMLSREGPSGSLIPAVILVWPFIFDTSLTVIRRLIRRENVFAAHRSHLYQRLNVAGYSHRWISTLYTLFAIEGMAGAISFPRASTAVQMAIVAAVASTALIYWRFVLHAERSLATPAD
jgi:UDP-N-acetylmuramyl pentapeptide phosphotransferase/UDP-N-acetylglucosamine-1-phosphate transferase